MKSSDIIIIGGSYAGLAAGMALGRALKNVLIIDDAKPCNLQTPYSHNFLTNDGKSPSEITRTAVEQVKKYETVKFFKGLATEATSIKEGFEIRVSSGEIFTAGKLIFATGIKDLLPEIEGLSHCWGISAIHCPYCHGYEVRNKKTAILGNGDAGCDFSRFIYNWTKDLTLLTNGISRLTIDQRELLKNHNIPVIEKEITNLKHLEGYLENIFFRDGTKLDVTVLYAPSPFEQSNKIPESLGCTINEDGYIQTDPFQETTVPGIYACGDNSNRIRTISNAIATGTTAGISLSKKMIMENFK